MPKCVLALCDRDGLVLHAANLQIISFFSMAKCNLKTQAGQTLEVQTYLEASNGPHSAFAWS